MTTFLWVIVPYICLAIFVVGHFWRYRYDKFGWTTRSSQLYEDRLLRWGSPMFHFGMLWVVMGHFLGLVIPKSWTSFIPEQTYHTIAVVGGAIAGILALVGVTILIYRRRTTGPVFSATTPMDKVMYFFLGLVIVLGCINTLGTSGAIALGSNEYDYREGVSVWFRSIFWFQPQPELMPQAPWSFQAHSLVAFILFALWPFTRLVHVFSAPLGYFTRPYIVYRSRDSRPGTGVGTRAPGRGWDRSELQKK